MRWSVGGGEQRLQQQLQGGGANKMHCMAAQLSYNYLSCHTYKYQPGMPLGWQQVRWQPTQAGWTRGWDVVTKKQEVWQEHQSVPQPVDQLIDTEVVKDSSSLVHW